MKIRDSGVPAAPNPGFSCIFRRDSCGRSSVRARRRRHQRRSEIEQVEETSGEERPRAAEGDQRVVARVEPPLHAHLLANGVDIVEEGFRYGAAGDGYSIYFNDPFGNQIELKSAPDA